MPQYGFFVDLSRCIGCHACVIACKQWHHVPAGSIKWIRVHQWEDGVFPAVRVHVLPVFCFHCEDPICVKVCPHEAIFKEKNFGAVFVNRSQCRGTRKCWHACPYGAPQYEDDAPNQKMSKCNMCFDRLENGDIPICVLSCSMRALEFGPIHELRKRYGRFRRLEYMPEDRLTRPAVLFRPPDAKKQLIPWDSHKTLELWKKRRPYLGEPLPDIFSDTSEVLNPPLKIVGRNRFVLKAKKSTELMYVTTDDE